MAAKKEIGKAAVLEFLGSLVFLYLAFSFALGSWSPAWLAGAGALWTPIVAAAALVSAITLFIMSLVGLAGKGGDMLSKGLISATWWGGFSLFILTTGGPYFWWTVVGFLLAYIGSGWESMM